MRRYKINIVYSLFVSSELISPLKAFFLVWQNTLYLNARYLSNNMKLMMSVTLETKNPQVQPNS